MYKRNPMTLLATCGLGLAYLCGCDCQTLRQVIPGVACSTGGQTGGQDTSDGPDEITPNDSNGSSDGNQADDPQASLVIQNGFRPDLSPDGTRVVFMRLHYTQGQNPYDGQTDIWIVNVDGSSLQRLTDTASDEFDPQWHPNGNAIAFLRTEGDFFSHTSGALLTINPDGSGEALVRPNDLGQARYRGFCFYKSNNHKRVILVHENGELWMTLSSEYFDGFVGEALRRSGGDLFGIRANPSANSRFIALDTNLRRAKVFDPANLDEFDVASQYSFPRANVDATTTSLVAGADGGIDNGIYVIDIATGLPDRITHQIDLEPSMVGSRIVFTRIPSSGLQFPEFGNIYTIIH
jgi:dipeptidyl aminopeptidase/acylaminoacyl peptidase